MKLTPRYKTYNSRRGILTEATNSKTVNGIIPNCFGHPVHQEYRAGVFGIIYGAQYGVHN